MNSSIPRPQSIIETLHREATEIIRDPIHHDIPFSVALKALTGSSVMMKLHSIRQLGPAYLLYPGAQHTRYEHSLGVYAVARQMILSLLSREPDGNRFPFTLDGIHAFFTACLLHDVGHFPYAHALKDCIKEEHEAIGAEKIEQDQQLRDIITTQIGTSVSAVCQIIDPDRTCEDPEILFYRSVLSGTLDPDKLDYLCRDAFYCGVPYGVQDVDYLLRHIGITENNSLYLDDKALGAVEHLLFSKYLMYKYVYWHASTRSATAMIKKAVLLARADGTLRDEELTHLDDHQFANLMYSLTGSVSSELFERVREGQLFKETVRIPYDHKNRNHLRYSSEAQRTALEKEIWNDLVVIYPDLKEFMIVLDISEKVTFESNLPIRNQRTGSMKMFNSASELFSDQLVTLFTSSLREFRLFTPEKIDSSIAEQIVRKYL